MTRKTFLFLFTFIAGGIIGHVAISSIGRYFAQPSIVMAQTQKPVYINRLYTGPDNQAHIEKVELKFNADKDSVTKRITGAQFHWTPGGTVLDWHRAPIRQYVIQLSGRAEIEVAGGKTIVEGPGDVLLVEDTTGKGHIMRVTSDRLSLDLPLADQLGR